MDVSVEQLHSVFADIAIKLKTFFETREYGNDLLHIFVGVILTHPDSSRLHPIRRPNYKKLLKYKSSITNEKVEMKSVFQYDVRLDYEVFRKRFTAISVGRGQVLAIERAHRDRAAQILLAVRWRKVKIPIPRWTRII